MGLCKQYAPVSRYFKAEDILDANGREVVELVLTIKDVGEAKFDDGRSQPTIMFEEHEKVLGLNKTNREKLAELFGQDDGSGQLDFEPQDIIGQKISVYRSKTQNKEGATVPCVRIRAVQQRRAPAPARQPNAAPPAQRVPPQSQPRRAPVQQQAAEDLTPPDDGAPWVPEDPQ